MQEIITLIVQTIIMTIGLIVGRYVVPFLHTKIDSNKLETAKKITEYLVSFAEAVFTDEKMGEDKLSAVTTELTEQLNKRNIKMSEAEIRGLIEKVVAEMNQNKGE